MAAPPNGSGEPVRLSEPDEREAYRILDFALRAGEVLLAGGAGASDATATVMALANACGLRRVECDITFTSIVVSYVRAPDVAPVTSMRVVRARALDYTRVTEVHNLVEDLLSGRSTRTDAYDRLGRIRRAGHPYRRWSVTVALASLAAAVTVLLGGGPLVAAAGFGSTVLVDRVNRRLAWRNVPQFYQNAVGAAIATGVAVLLVAAGADVQPSLVVAGGIILLLPGTTLVGSVQDAITGFLVTASARAFEVFLLTAGIITGVALSLYVAVRAGVPVLITESAPSLRQIPVQVLAAGIASACFAFANYAPRRTLPGAGLAGALGWGAFIGLDRAHVSPAFATGAAAVLVGLGSYTLAHRQRAPALLFVSAGTIPLLPGLTIYRGMYRLSEGDTIGGIITLSQALSIGLALAAGVILGQFLAQPVRREVDRFERRIVGPRLAGPLGWRRRP